MKLKCISLVLIPLLYYSILFAQKTELVTVKAGNIIKESLQAADLYDYPQFTKGTVFLKNGKTSNVQLDYNRFLDEMQFITATGDTLTIANEENIQFISIEKDTFFYDKGYLQLVTNGTTAKLGIKQTLRIIDKEKIGAYGSASPTTAIDSYDSYNDNTKSYGLTIMQDVILAKGTQYYIGNMANQFVLPNKKNLQNLFPKQQKAIANYFKENKVAYNSKEDLEKLTQFLEQSK